MDLVLSKLSELQTDSPISDRLLENIKTILTILVKEYTNGPSWLFEFHLYIREDDCISIEWLKEDIYCSIFSDLVLIDKTRHYPNEIVMHRHREFRIINTQSIYSNFKIDFEAVCF